MSASAAHGIPWRSVGVIVASVLFAGGVLALGWPALVVLAAMVVIAIGLGRLARWMASRSLPVAPLNWAKWAPWMATGRYAVMVSLAATALWGAVEFGDELDAAIAGSAAIGTVFAIALVKALDKVSDDDEWIEHAVGKDAKQIFQDAYRNQFAPDGPLPQETKDGDESTAWIAVFVDHIGWDASGRTTRARQLYAEMQALPSPIIWAR